VLLPNGKEKGGGTRKEEGPGKRVCGVVHVRLGEERGGNKEERKKGGEEKTGGTTLSPPVTGGGKKKPREGKGGKREST